MEQIRIQHNGTWKVCSLYTVGMLKTIINQLSTYKADIVFLQEIQCTGSGILENKTAPSSMVVTMKIICWVLGF